MKVMEIAFMALHALEARAKEVGDGSTGAIIKRHVSELARFAAHYFNIDASQENLEAAKDGAMSARAAAEQAHLQHAQLDAQVTGGGAATIQRDRVRAHLDEVAGNEEHAAAVAKSQELAAQEEAERRTRELTLEDLTGQEANEDGEFREEPAEPASNGRRRK